MTVIFKDYYPSIDRDIKNKNMAIASLSMLEKAIKFISFNISKPSLDSIDTLLEYTDLEVEFSDQKEKELINDKKIAFFEYENFEKLRVFAKNNLTHDNYNYLKENLYFSIIPLG
jgi:hypothetical protein